MDLSKILDYQNAVIESEKIKETYTEDEFYIKVRKLQVEKKRIEMELEALTGSVNAHEAALETILKEIEAVKKEIEYLAEESLENVDESFINENLKYLEKYENQLNDLNTQNKNEWGSLVNANRASSDATGKLAAIKKVYEPLKVKIGEFNAKAQSSISEATKRINETAAKLTDEEKAIYNEAREAVKRTNRNLKGSQIAQVFVKINNGYCKCGIELDPTEQEKLLKNKYVKCQNCGKIVYID